MPLFIKPLDVLAAVIALDLIDEDHKLMLRGTKSPTSVVSKLHHFYQVTNLIDTVLYSIEADEIANARYHVCGRDMIEDSC